MPHSAEYCAGYYDYNSLLDGFNASSVDLTFTCLEKDDSEAYKFNLYSAPKTLVITIATLANEKKLKHFGENADPITSDVRKKYENCAEMLFNYKFSGFTLLRIEHLVNPDGSKTGNMLPFKDVLVRDPVPVMFTVNGANTKPGENLYVSGESWEMANWTFGGYAFPLDYNSGQWKGTMYLGEGRTYKFKAIKKDEKFNFSWEGGSDSNLGFLHLF